MSAADLLVSILLEAPHFYHGRANLQAAATGNGFQFFRNGFPIGLVMQVHKDYGYSDGKLMVVGYLVGMGVKHTMHGTGLGRAMIEFVLQHTPYQVITLDAAVPAFYKKLGFRRLNPKGWKMALRREDFTGSSLHFDQISEE